MKTKFFLVFSMLIVLSLVLINCSNDNPDDNTINLFSVDDDVTLGLDVSKQIEGDAAHYPILSETQYPAAYQHIRRIRDSILNSGKVFYKTKFTWDVKIINDSVLNAFCTPGGHIYFYKGLIKFLDNEAQFAGVMAHEMAHADRRHTTDQMTKQYGVTYLLQLILGKDPGLLAQVGQYLLTLKFSRNDEDEADEYSVIYLYPTSYDAKGTAGFFQKLEQGQSGGLNIPFLSTHPSDASRISNINAKWTALGGKTGNTYETSYQAFKNSLPN